MIYYSIDLLLAKSRENKRSKDYKKVPLLIESRIEDEEQGHLAFWRNYYRLFVSKVKGAWGKYDTPQDEFGIEMACEALFTKL